MKMDGPNATLIRIDNRADGYLDDPEEIYQPHPEFLDKSKFDIIHIDGRANWIMPTIARKILNDLNLSQDELIKKMKLDWK